MTTFNTGNPVEPNGSPDPRDLHDTAQVEDVLVNHPTKTEAPDRLGRMRKTWHGMEQDFQQFLLNSGYTGTGAGGAYEDYDANGPLTISALNEIFTKDGEFYRLKPDQAIPYTTTAWMDDQDNMVAIGDAVLRQELASGSALVSSTSGQQVISEALNYRKISISTAVFGATGDGVSDDTAPLELAQQFVDSYGFELDFGSKTYLISSQLTLPKFFTGSDATISGAACYRETTKFAEWSGVRFDELVINGMWHSDFSNLKGTKFVIRGYAPSWGSFYNEFKNSDFIDVEINVQEFAVNQNTFINFHAKGNPGNGLTITDGSNTGPTFYECHNNIFIGCDFSYGDGVSNESALQQTNILAGCYIEGSSSVSGPFDIRGMNADIEAVPAVGPMNSILGMTEQIERTGSDFLSLPTANMVPGGTWEHMAGNGIPIGIGGFGQVTQNSDGALWWGSDLQFGGVTSDDFQAIQVTIPPSYTGKFSACGFWVGELPKAIEVAGDQTASYGTGGFVNLGNNIYLFRLSGKTRASDNTALRFFVTTNDGFARTGFLGAIYVSPFKIAPIPYSERRTAEPPSIRRDASGVTARGLVRQDNVSSGETDISVDISAARFSSAPMVFFTLEADSSAYSSNLDSAVIVGRPTQTSFTVRLKYTSDFQGFLHWKAEGS